MKYESEVFKNQFPIVKGFVYHWTYYQILSKGYRERQLQNKFWTLTINAHLLRATIDWCMVFGSDNNPTHWKRLSIVDSEVLNVSFREGLFKATGLDPDTWQQYWEIMTEFRNQYAAHRELEFASPVPNFDTALIVAYYYDDWVRRVISPDTFAAPTLKSVAISLQKSVTPLVEKLLEVTGGHAEPGAAGDAR